MIYVLIALANFVNIGCRAFQQQNVIQGNYKAVVPTSALMACVEVATYGGVAVGVVENGLFSVEALLLSFSLAVGGTLGCITSMVLHRRLFRDNW